VDLLYPGVTEKFLDLTLGTYQREIGDQFGKRVPGVFTDEPNIRPTGGWPWTEDLPAQFQRRWGYDLIGQLPSLHGATGDWRKVRHNYFSVLNELFIERWAKPYGVRCSELGLQMTGHYWEHEWPDTLTVPDNMAMYAWEQRPAIDCLMNQYAEHTHAQFGNVRSVRELGSIANQLAKPRTLCEVYGAGGWDLRFEDMKRQADWLAVLGVNTFDQHLSYITIRGARKRDHPQSFSYHEPWWDAYKICGQYLERLAVAVSGGEQVNHVLVLEPTTTAWMYQGDSAALDKLGDVFFKLLQSLEAAQVEYDLGCEDVIARYGSVQGQAFRIGRRDYQTVVLPPLVENLNARTWELLVQFAENGGQVLGARPTAPEGLCRRDGALLPGDSLLLADNRKWVSKDSADLIDQLLASPTADGFRVRRASGDQGTLFHMRRQLDDGELVLLVNTSIEHGSAGNIESKAHGIEHWNLETGSIEPYPFERGLSTVQADFDLPPCGSLVLFLSKQTRAADERGRAPGVVRSITGGIEVRRLEPNVLPLDFVDITAGGEARTNICCYQASQFAFHQNGMERNPWDSAVQYKDELINRRFPANSGFEATYRFRVEPRVPEHFEVAVERPDLYQIRCNGETVQPTPGAWWLDKAFGRIDLSSAAKVGTNTITLEAHPFTIYHELEPVYLLGDFSLKASDNGFIVGPDRALELGPWKDQGQPFYSGGVGYRQRFELPDAPVGDYVVRLPKWYGSVARIMLNGNLAGYIGWAPWECEVGKLLVKGENTIEVTVIGTLKNTLGPHHGRPPLGTAWPGSFQKAPVYGPPPGEAYDTVAYGLFTPFTLEQRQ
jgi:hypothetical protein